MGHGWRDMDPQGAADSDRLRELEDKLMLRIRNLSTENLSVGQLLDILDVYHPRFDGHHFTDRDAKVLKDILDHIPTDPN